MVGEQLHRPHPGIATRVQLVDISLLLEAESQVIGGKGQVKIVSCNVEGVVFRLTGQHLLDLSSTLEGNVNGAQLRIGEEAVLEVHAPAHVHDSKKNDDDAHGNKGGLLRAPPLCGRGQGGRLPRLRVKGRPVRLGRKRTVFERLRRGVLSLGLCVLLAKSHCQPRSCFFCRQL